jgi:hypothetical protein
LTTSPTLECIQLAWQKLHYMLKTQRDGTTTNQEESASATL